MILIISLRTDYHAAVVKYFLDRESVACDFFTIPDMPNRLKYSWNIDSGREGSVSWSSQAEPRTGTFYKSVWNRRSFYPAVPADAHPSDISHIQSHNRLAATWLKRRLISGALLLNSFEGQARAVSKLEQLSCARAVGMAIPATLFSNDQDDIVEFKARHGRIIGKPIYKIDYQNGDKVFSGITKVLEEIESFDPRSFQYMPYLYQSLVMKVCDVRVFVAGLNIFAVRIDSQSRQESMIDFRAIGAASLPHTRFEINAELRSKILALMQGLGISFGLLDFALDESGEMIFLEVNEQGNWLWLEQHVPGLPILDCFIKMLLSSDPAYIYREGEGRDFEVREYEAQVDYKSFVALEASRHNEAPEECAVEG